MKVVMVGSGNVATVLGRLIKRSGHQILQVVSRNEQHARELAALLDCPHIDYSGVPAEGADLYIFAINDSALFDLDRHFKIGHSLVVHTAGSISKEVLKSVSTNYGVLYPLQSLRKEMDSGLPIPLLVDGNTRESATLIGDFARSISDLVSTAGDADRLKLHVAAVVVCNFTNHLYALAETFCKKENVDFKMLAPLIMETAYRVKDNSPSAVQTGPAIRNDLATIDKHLELLEGYPGLRSLYQKFTESIRNGS